MPVTTESLLKVLSGAAWIAETIDVPEIEVQSNYGLTLAFDPEKLPDIRKKLVQALREVSIEAERGAGERKNVYRLNLSFFPVSK